MGDAVFDTRRASGVGVVDDAAAAPVEAAEAPLISLDGGQHKERRGLCARMWEYALGPHVSLYWVEKAILIIHYGQLWGLFWAFGRAWPLPFVLRNQTRWVVWFNLDLPSAYTFVQDDEIPALRGSTYGVFNNYVAVGIAWASLPGLMALGYFLALRYAWLKYWDMRAIRIWLQDVVILLSLLLYLPALLALSRLYVCENNPNYVGLRLAVDPQLPCFEYAHFIVALACLPSTLLIWLGLPAYMILHIREQLVYRRRHEHERYIRWKEAEYVHGLSFDWRRGHFWLFSSFRRTVWHVYDRPLWLLTMSLLIIVYCYSRRTPYIMADVLFAVMIIWQVRQFVFPGYRCGTTNVLANTIYLGMCIVIFWGVMRAHGIVNQFTVDSAFTLAQRGMNAALVVVIAFIMAMSFWPSFGWPRAYVGPEMWRTLMAKEAADDADRGFDDLGLPTRPRRHSTVLRDKAGPLEALVFYSKRACACLVRRPASRARAGRDAASDGASSASASVHDPASGASALVHPDGAPRPVVHGLPLAEHGLVPPSEPPDVGSSDFDAMLEARERDYDVRTYYGDQVADQVLLQKKKAAFAWDAGASTGRGSAGPGFDLEMAGSGRAGTRVSTRNLMVQSAAMGTTPYPGGRVSTRFSGIAMGASAMDGEVEQLYGRAGMGGSRRGMLELGDDIESARNIAPADVESMPGMTLHRRSNASISAAAAATPANSPLALLRPEVSADDSSVDSTLQQRSLTEAEVSALEAVWVTTVKTARECLRANTRLPAEIVNVPLLRRWLKILKREFRRANRCRHVLAWSLEECMDDISALADEAESRTIFPNPVLEALLKHLKERLTQREIDYALTSTKRRYLITKLVAVSAFVGDRQLASLHIPGVNDHLFKAAALGETESTESEDLTDTLVAYAHISSIYRDVLPLEISMMGVSELQEVVSDVLCQRIVVDVVRLARQHDWALPRAAIRSRASSRNVLTARGAGGVTPALDAPGGTGAPSEALPQYDVSLLQDASYSFPSDGLLEETREMLVAVFDRITELLGDNEVATAVNAGSSLNELRDIATSRVVQPADLMMVVQPWLQRFAPEEAAERGLGPWTPPPPPHTARNTTSSRLSSRADEITESMLVMGDSRLVDLRPDTSMSTSSTVRPFSASMLNTARSTTAGGAGRHHHHHPPEHTLSTINEGIAASTVSLGSGVPTPSSSRGFGGSARGSKGLLHTGSADEEDVHKWSEADVEGVYEDDGQPLSARSAGRAAGSGGALGRQPSTASTARSSRRNVRNIPSLRLRPVFEGAATAAGMSNLNMFAHEDDADSVEQPEGGLL